MSFFSELRRRSVIKAATAYLIAAWVVIEVASVILPVFDSPPWVMRALVVAAALGLPVVLIFSWAYEITPRGIVRSEDIRDDDLVQTNRGRRLNYIIIGLLVTAVALLAVTHRGFDHPIASVPSPRITADDPRDSRQVPEPSIAVLPFDDLSPDPGQQYFSDGLSEELLAMLANVTGLRVAARTSAFSFREADLQLSEIAQRLKVDHLLVGTVRRSGDELRITTRLIHAEDGYIQWSASYERRLDDVFAVQEEIATTVVEHLKSSLLTDEPRAEHTDPNAYALFLRGRYLARRFTPESMSQAVGLFQQALAIDPGYLPAYNNLAAVYINQGDFGIRPRDEGYELARQAVETALSLDPRYGPAYDRLGWIAMNHGDDLAGAAWYYQRALELDPRNDAIVGNAAVLAVALGRLDEAIRLMDHAEIRDPVDTVGYANKANACFLAGRLDEAEEALDTVLSLSPDYQGARYRRSLIYLLRGDPERALAESQQETMEAARLIGTALAYYSLGRREDSEATLQLAKDKWGDFGAGNYAQVHAWRGENDLAFEWLERELEMNGSGAFMEYQHDPLLEGLHSDARWQPILKRAGYDRDRLARIAFDVRLPD